VQSCLDAALADSAVAKKLGDLSQYYGVIVHAPLSGINASFSIPDQLNLLPEKLTIKNEFVAPVVNKQRTLPVISDDAPGLLSDQVKGPMAYAYGLSSANQTSGGFGDDDELLGAPTIGFNGFYGLCAQHLDYLGWIPAAQHLSYSSAQAQNNLGVSTQVVLRALGAAGPTPAGEYQEVRVEPLDPTSSFSFGGLTVEFRRNLTDVNGNTINLYLFDGQVLIYKGIYANGTADTIRINDNSPSNSWEFGRFDHTMQPGDDFFDFEDMVVIHFDSIDSANNTATIHISAFQGN
jgi:hypothetical protein